MRSKYGEYPEYHTSLDDLNLVTPAGLKGGYLALKLALEVIEQNVYPKITVLGEPQLGKRGLYPNISKKRLSGETQTLMNLLTYCDGKRTLLEIADLIGQPMWDLVPFVEQLKEYGLLDS
jgi:aminopeptidase-like protein